jgi:hypothetical protein
VRPAGEALDRTGEVVEQGERHVEAAIVLERQIAPLPHPPPPIPFPLANHCGTRAVTTHSGVSDAGVRHTGGQSNTGPGPVFHRSSFARTRMRRLTPR